MNTFFLRQEHDMGSKIAAEKIIDVLVESGITHFFGLPGGYIIELYKALYGRDDEIKVVVPRDEQTASCMAEMYGKLTGKPGVFAAQGAFAGSTGMFGVIEARLSHTPMVVLSELSDLDSFMLHGPIQCASGNYGSFDLPSIYKSNTKYTAIAHFPRDAVLGVQLAIKHAMTGKTGPTACLFRSSAVKGSVEDSGHPEIYDTRRLLTPSKTCPPAELVQAAAEILAPARNPVIVSGNGVRLSRAFDELREFAELLGAPVVTSYLGKSSIAETHPLAAGPIGYTGTPMANETLGQADVVLVVGSRLKPQETCFGNPKLFDPRRQRIVHIDIDGHNTSWTVPAELALVGDAGLTLKMLAKALAPLLKSARVTARKKAFVASKEEFAQCAWSVRHSNSSPIYPQRFVQEVNEVAPEDAIICTDAGNNRHWMNHFFQTKRADSYFGTGGLGGVSWSMAATLAAKIIRPERPAIGICSDGGFAMQMHVLLTARQYEAAPIYVVMNNSSLGMTSQGMGDRRVGTEFPDFDFAAIAQSCGCFGARATKPGEIAEALRAALDQDKPAVIDAVINKNQNMSKEIFSPWALEVSAGTAMRVY